MKDMLKQKTLLLLLPGIMLISDTVLLLIKTASRTLGIFMPMLLGIPLLVAAAICVFYPKLWRMTIGKILKWLMIVGYSAFLLLFILTTVLTFSVGHKAAPDDADVLIVLGCGVKGDRVTLTLSRRLDRAITYLNENKNTRVIVSGGKGKGENITEAYAMQEYLIAHGIEKERIIQEDASHSTEENFRFSKDIIDRMYPNGAKVCYITTYFHVYRAGRVAHKCGIEASGMGAKGVWYITPNDYLRECIAISMYFLTGRV